jgi:hypothetical protein
MELSVFFNDVLFSKLSRGVKMYKYKIVIRLLLIFLPVFMLITIGGCSQTTEPPTAVVASPKNIKLALGATPLDSSSSSTSYATVSWDASADENNTDFRGYRIVTVELNSSNQVKLNLEDKALDKSVKSYTIDDILPMKRYKSYIVAELSDGTRSDSIGTPVYSGIFYAKNGSIDSYTSSGNSQSSYGWNTTTGEGTQYTFNQPNSQKIDLHLREESTGILFFKSPDFLDELNGTNYRYTKMNLLGYGQQFFDNAILSNPDSLFRTEAPVSIDGVYLLKTEEGNYIKLWVKDIQQTGNPVYFNVKFYYKVQPISELKVL